MKNLIQLQLRSFFKFKNIIIFTASVLFYLCLQLLRLNQQGDIYNLKINVIDFIFFALGGWQEPITFPFILSWVFLNFIFVYISIILATNMDELTLFIIHRVQNRTKLWITHCVSQLLLSILLTLFVLLITTIVGSLFFQTTWQYSSYSSSFYALWTENNISITNSFLVIASVLFSGWSALFIFIQFILRLSFSKINAVMAVVTVVIFTTIAHVFGFIPRVLSPFLFMSSLSILPNPLNILLAIGFNISFTIIFIITGMFLFRKQEIR
ncbi:hypothetical protein ABE099_07810 [Paenibacillus turicensis]|uniref:hypothetical protein n=1 Tax=Paenibacillus turicensis TaxID=160487 RepID=UPI003D28FAF2